MEAKRNQDKLNSKQYDFIKVSRNAHLLQIIFTYFIDLFWFMISL